MRYPCNHVPKIILAVVFLFVASTGLRQGREPTKAPSERELARECATEGVQRAALVRIPNGYSKKSLSLFL